MRPGQISYGHGSVSNNRLQVETFGHLVQIETLGVVVDSMVYFFANAAITKSVPGRSGWLDRIHLGIVDYDRTLYLAAYDVESK